MILTGAGVFAAAADDVNLCQSYLSKDAGDHNKNFVGRHSVSGRVLDIVPSDQMPGGVIVNSRVGASPTEYNVTDRTYSDLVNGGIDDKGRIYFPPLYPKEWLGLEDVKGLDVADLGCGNSGLVIELEHAGAHAIAVDIFPSVLLKLRPELFKQASLDSLSPIPDESKDVLINTMTIYTYEFKKLERTETSSQFNRKLILDSFNEAHRVLKPGGVMLVSPILPASISQFMDFFNSELRTKFAIKLYEIPLVNYPPVPFFGRRIELGYAIKLNKK